MAPLNPLYVFITAFIIAGLGGLAALLRSKNVITWRTALSALLSSGLMGLTAALLWYNYFEGQKNIYFLLGLCGLMGLGGVTVIDFFLRIAKKGGLNIVIKPGSGDEPKSKDSKK
jgi:hypothetical protein